jgi:signal transduction histidine kinase
VFVSAHDSPIERARDPLGVRERGERLVGAPVSRCVRAQVQMLWIIHEGLTNVRKHGRSAAVRVSLDICGANARAIVEDDGVGFVPDLLRGLEGRKFGLGFMRERAESVGGSLEIESAPDEGTRVTISMPLSKAPS